MEVKNNFRLLIQSIFKEAWVETVVYEYDYDDDYDVEKDWDFIKVEFLISNQKSIIEIIPINKYISSQWFKDTIEKVKKANKINKN